VTEVSLDPRVTRAQGMRMINLAYLLALGVAFLAGGLVAGGHPIAVGLVADVAATVAVFAFSFAFRNSSFYDPYWSVAPVPLLIYWAWDPGVADPTRRWLLIGLVFVWGCRLTFNWWRGWTGLDHEDWRYADLQDQTGRFYWLVSFSGIHMFPTIQVFLGCLAAYPAVALGAGRPFGWLDWVAVVVIAGAIAIETVADRQLVRFKRSNPEPGTTLHTGLWRYSRHPNYFGEISFWWGLWLFGLAADPGWWWTVIGPVAMTAMFHFASLPMIENRMLARRKDYERVIATTSRLIPMPPRKATGA
jgi:steroid 5-alpha reductase family enzyme